MPVMKGHDEILEKVSFTVLGCLLRKALCGFLLNVSVRLQVPLTNSLRLTSKIGRKEHSCGGCPSELYNRAV